MKAAPVELRPMAAAEFARFIRRATREYGRSRARAEGVALAKAMTAARRQTRSLLPKGAATPSHLFYSVLAAGTSRPVVGSIWLFLSGRGRARRAYLYDLRIEARFRGRGLGRAAMLAFERRAAELGARSAALNVFGYNLAARALYESLGYAPDAIRMRKALASVRVRPGSSPGRARARRPRSPRGSA